MKRTGIPLTGLPVTFLPSSEDGAERRGRYEEHYLKGWPEGQAHGLKQCTEHSENCAVRVNYTNVPIVRWVIFDGGGGPFLELG